MRQKKKERKGKERYFNNENSEAGMTNYLPADVAGVSRVRESGSQGVFPSLMLSIKGVPLCQMVDEGNSLLLQG